MVHRINIFLLSIILVIAQVITMNQALAAGLNGWTLQNPIVKGASVAYEGVKNVIINGKNVAKTSTALITPTASQVAKLLGKGVAGVALSFAVEQLLGKVDWVLDPANNQIKYTDVKDGTGSYFIIDGKKYYTSSLSSACTQYANSIGDYFDSTMGNANCAIRKGGMYGSIYYIAVGVVVGEPVEEQKTLPLDVVAQKVISNAESGNSDAKAAITAAAADIVNDAQNDDAKAKPIVNQLEANAQTKTEEEATGQTKPNTTTGGTDLSLTFPVFCGWAPVVCEAAQTVINFPITLTDWWNTGKTKAESWAQSISEAWATTKEWMTKDDTPEENTEVDIDQTVPQVPNTSYFNWGAYCPFTPGSQTISLDNTSAGLDYDLTSWCELASELRPFVLAAGALMSFLIASGVIMGRDD